MEYKHHKDFLPSVRELRKRGGPYQKAAERVQSICGAKGLELDADPLVTEKMTNYGETRINKCWKYDLAGAARLITIRDNGIVLLCYVGDHDDCTKWLNRNKGMTLIRSDKGQIDYTNESSNIDDPIRLSGETSLIDGCLFEHISPDSYFDQLVEGIPRKVVRNLEGIESIHTEPEIYEIIKELGDVNQASTIYDVFVLLRQDKRKEAVDRIKLYLGEISPVSKLSDEQVAELADSQNIKTLKSDDPYYQQVFEYFVNNANYMDWMLFLHPDQQAIVDADYNGSTKLLGVSGSGKTCIVVQRAIALAKKYPEESVLVLTLDTIYKKILSYFF